jgi:ankyrin repeat protein
MFACRYGAESAAIKLLKRNDIQVNLQNNDGSTALMHACQHGAEPAVMNLLERKDIQVNLRNSNGWTALMFACVGKHENIVKILLHDMISNSIYSEMPEKRRS